MIPDSPNTGGITAIIDVENKKVFCVLLQAMYGGNSQVCSLFHTDKWIVAPPENLEEKVKTGKIGRFTGTGAEWWQLANKWNNNVRAQV